MEFEQLITLITAVSDSELTRFSYEENGTVIQMRKEKEEKLEKESEQMCLGWKWVCKGTNPCKELKKKKISEEKEMRFGS